MEKGWLFIEHKINCILIFSCPLMRNIFLFKNTCFKNFKRDFILVFKALNIDFYISMVKTMVYIVRLARNCQILYYAVCKCLYGGDFMCWAGTLRLIYCLCCCVFTELSLCC